MVNCLYTDWTSIREASTICLIQYFENPEFGNNSENFYPCYVCDFSEFFQVIIDLFICAFYTETMYGIS